MTQSSGEQRNQGWGILWDRLCKWWFGFFIIGLLSTGSATAAVIYVTDKNSIYVTDYNGQSVKEVINGLNLAWGLAVADNRIFWVEFINSNQKIRSAHIDGSNLIDVITEGSPRGIAINPNSRKLYWRDSDLKMIRSSDLDGQNIVNIVNTNDGSRGIALDVVGGKIYWTDIWTDTNGSNWRVIRQSNLDGSGASNLTSPGAQTGTNLAVDHKGGRLFSTSSPSNTCEHSLSTGEARCTSGSWWGDLSWIAIDEQQRYLFITIGGNGQGTIYKLDLELPFTSPYAGLTYPNWRWSTINGIAVAPTGGSASATINQLTPLDGGFSISGASQTGEVSSIVKFGIEVRDDNGATVTYEATPNEDGTFSKVIEGLTNGLRYFVKVFTVDAAQTQGPASAPVSVIPQAAPQDAKEWGRNLPPILLLHGWRSNGETWKSVKKELLDIEANVSAPTFQAATSALDNDNLCAEATELPSLIDQIRYGKSKVIVIAHSQGGIVARAYMQFGARPDVFIDNFTAGDALGGHFARCKVEFAVDSPIFRRDIEKLITYGTPHKGADKCPLNLCSAYPLLAPDNQLLALLNNFYLFPLPEDVSIVNLVGRLSSSSSDDCLISTTSQDMRNVGYPADFHIIDGVRHFDSKPCAGYFDRKKKTETQDSLNIFKHGLGAPEYIVRALSPVDLTVVDPEYRTISKDKRELWGAIYEEQTDDSGHTTDVIRIPFPVSGNYQITVVPDPGAAPTETFSIETELSGVTTRLVENMPIQDIPGEPFTVAVDITPDPFSFVDQTGVARNRVINSNPITVSGINQPAAITILGGEYSVNGGAYTSVSGLVDNGDTVSVRHTSAATYDTATDTVLSIGGYSDVFTSTTMSECVSTPALTVALTLNRLWPPNHNMVTITADVQASDTCDPNPTVTLVSITSNEPDNGLGDGDTPNDIQGAELGTDDRTFALRAERSGSGTGRIYAITYQAANSAGKTSTVTAQVVVPHDQGK